MKSLVSAIVDRATRPARNTDWYRNLVARMASDAQLPVWKATGRLYEFANADIDEYRARFGKAEGEREFFARHRPTRERFAGSNLLTYRGASNMWEYALGNGTTSTGQTLTYLGTACYLGVGDSSTAATYNDTDLNAATNKVRNAADSTYPKHTAGASGVAISAATNASPIVITATSHGFSTNDVVTVSGVAGNTAANGTWQITVSDANTFSLNNSSGNAAYTSGGLASKAPVLVIQSTFGNSTGNFNWNEWGVFNASSSGAMINHSVVSLGTKVSTATWTLLVAISLG